MMSSEENRELGCWDSAYFILRRLCSRSFAISNRDNVECIEGSRLPFMMPTFADAYCEDVNPVVFAGTINPDVTDVGQPSKSELPNTKSRLQDNNDEERYRDRLVTNVAITSQRSNEEPSILTKGYEALKNLSSSLWQASDNTPIKYTPEALRELKIQYRRLILSQRADIDSISQAVVTLGEQRQALIEEGKRIFKQHGKVTERERTVDSPVDGQRLIGGNKQISVPTQSESFAMELEELLISYPKVSDFVPSGKASIKVQVDGFETLISARIEHHTKIMQFVQGNMAEQHRGLEITHNKLKKL